MNSSPGSPQTQKLQDQAAAVHDQAIRDAKAADHPMTQIAAALGISNRVRLYGVLDKSYDNPAAAIPTPVVYLRGAGAPKTVWDDIETAMHRRGLMVVKDRQQAWHLARGGVPVVIVDFSTGSDVTVGRVKARWKDVHRQRTIGQLLPTRGTGTTRRSRIGLVDRTGHHRGPRRGSPGGRSRDRDDTSGTTSSTPNSLPEPPSPNCPEPACLA